MSITSESRVGEIATQHPLSTRVFSRYGIDFCCGGGLALSEACSKRGVDANAVITEIQQTLQSPEALNTKRWDSAPVQDLVNHILSQYHTPLHEELPRLEAMTRKVYRVHGDKEPEMLGSLLETYLHLKNEVDEHLREEEEALFPAILAGKDKPAPLLNAFVDDHSEVGKDLAKIRAITRDFEVPANACNTWTALWHGLAALETDLHEHIHLENNVLFPKVTA